MVANTILSGVLSRNSDGTFTGPGDLKFRLLQQSDLKDVQNICDGLYKHDIVPLVFENLSSYNSVYAIGAELNGRVVSKINIKFPNCKQTIKAYNMRWNT